MQNQFPPKPIDNPNHISLLLATRARPDKVKTLFDSLEATTHDPDQMDVWLFVDDDDTVSLELKDFGFEQQYSFKVHWLIEPRTPKNGDMYNILWQKSETNAGIYYPIPDDCRIETKHWDKLVRDAFNQYEDRIVLIYPDEATADPDEVTMVIVSAEWLNTLGRVFTSYFPYWFDDSWMDQVARMIGRRHMVPVIVNAQGSKGKTIRMRNLRFWHRFFHSTLDERITQAEALRRQISPVGTPTYQANLEKQEAVLKKFKAAADYGNREAIIYTERNFAGESIHEPPSEKYLAIETEAVHHLFDKVIERIAEPQWRVALDLLENIGFASQLFTNVEYVRALCLAAVGQYPAARKALRKELARQPDSRRTRTLQEQLDRGATVIPNVAVVRQLSLAPIGKNPDAIHPKLGLVSEMRIKMMPISLRFKIIRDIMSEYPTSQWPELLWTRWQRFVRRRL